MRTRSFRAVPNNPTGAPLNPCREWVGIIVPEATTNLLLNPSWELNTSNWTDSSTGSGGTPYARSTTAQCKGAYAAVLTIRSSSGTYVQIVAAAVTTSTLYTISFHVKRPGKGRVKAGDVRAFINNAAVEFDTIRYIGDGWWRCVKTFQATVTTAPGIRVLGSPGAIFYVDAAQLEAKGYETTYCDGDQMGLLPVETYPPFQWNGTPHASTSSRSALTRAGGREMNLKRYGFTLIAMMGLALSARAVIATPLGLLDGSLYQRTIRESRSFTLAGAFEESGPLRLSQKRAALHSALQHDLTGVDQPVVLTVQQYEGNTAIGAQGLIVGSYTDGLEGNDETMYSEKAAIQFKQWLPFVSTSTSIGGTISGQQTVTNANYVIKQAANGTWSALSTGMDAQITDMAMAPDGSLYVVGFFTTAGGGAANRIAKWDGSAWSALGTGLNSNTFCLTIGPDGSVYAGGNFTTAGGGAAVRVARWNGSAWSALGSGLNGIANTMVFGPDGDLYVGGEFTTAGGGAANYIAKWDGSTWSALGSGMSTFVRAIAFGPDGSLYAGGDFGTAGGISASKIAKWNGSAWSALGAGRTANVYSLVVGSDGSVYAGSDGTTAEDTLQRWNGTNWIDMGGGLTGGSSDVLSLDFGPGNVLYAGGGFTTANGITLPDSAAMWNGASWAPIPANLPGTALSQSILALPEGTIYYGYNTSGSAITAATATITNPGTSADLTVQITGPTSGAAKNVYSLINTTTGQAFYFNLSLVVNETATLIVKSTGEVTFRSNLRPELAQTILAVSSSRMDIVNGANAMSLLLNDSTMTATYSIVPKFESSSSMAGR